MQGQRHCGPPADWTGPEPQGKLCWGEKTKNQTVLLVSSFSKNQYLADSVGSLVEKKKTIDHHSEGKNEEMLLRAGVLEASLWAVGSFIQRGLRRNKMLC